MLRFSVPDMTCGHCSRAITEAIGQQVGSALVTVDLGNKTVQVEVEASRRDQVLEAIRQAGYTPSVLA